MKKILLSMSALVMLSTSANAELLLGVDYVAVSGMTNTTSYSSSLSDTNFDFSYQPIKFKLGFGTPGDNYWYLYYQSTEMTDKNGNKIPNALTEVGFDYVGQFETGVKGLNPFITYGFAGGKVDAKYANQDYRMEMSAKIGGGLSYYIIPQLELLASVDYQGRFWQPVEYATYGSTVTETSYDTGYNVTVGVNIWPFAD